MKLIRFRGKFKGLFFWARLHYLFGFISNLFIFIGYMSKLSKWIHKHKKIAYSDFYSFGFDYQKRYDLYKYVIEKENLTEIDYIEFGVAKGFSFKWWVENIREKTSAFTGFDTFTGLPEDWGPFKKGEMSNNDKVPEIDDNRVKFFQGLFQQTLEGFLKEHTFNKRTVIHMDADIYTATLYVLTTISPHLKKGDIIFFDEFNVPMHEFKAFSEWISSFYFEYEVIGAVNNFYQVAIKLK